MEEIEVSRPIVPPPMHFSLPLTNI